MCGLIGMIRKNNFYVRGLDKILTELLIVDTIRGYDSTGVFFMAKNTKKQRVRATVKEVMTGMDFVRQDPWAEICHHIEQVQFMVGHNRAASKGKVSKENAHPFTKGHITMAHNGTLYNHGKLVEGEFEVDSEALCNYLAESPRTAQNIVDDVSGAFAMVWEDRSKNTLNFMRNSQRPLVLAHTDNAIYFASEKAMLELILGRNNITVTNYEVVPVDTLISYNLDTLFRTEDVAKPKVYVYDSQNYDNWFTRKNHKSYYEDNNRSKPKLVENKYTVPLSATTTGVVGDPLTFLYVNDTQSDTKGEVVLEGKLHDQNIDSETTIVMGVVSEFIILRAINAGKMLGGTIKSIENNNGISTIIVEKVYTSAYDDPEAFTPINNELNKNYK